MAKTKAASPREALEADETASAKLGKKRYEEELAQLQLELIKLQEWIKQRGLKVVVIETTSVRQQPREGSFIRLATRAPGDVDTVG